MTWSISRRRCLQGLLATTSMPWLAHAQSLPAAVLPGARSLPR